jgi:UDP-glucose 4-epimerase
VGSRHPVSVLRLVELLGAKNNVVHIPKRPGEPDCTWADVTRIETLLGWKAKVSIEEGVAIMLDNMDYWRDAPVWTVDSIKEATADWFKYLGDEAKPEGK